MSYVYFLSGTTMAHKLDTAYARQFGSAGQFRRIHESGGADVRSPQRNGSP